MKAVFRCVLLALGVATWASAGTLIVSGDSNIGNGINSSDGSSAANNATFFANLLGNVFTGKNVVLQLTPDTRSASASDRDSEMAIASFYMNSGVTVNQVTSVAPTHDSFTAATLNGASLFISFLPAYAYTANEITAMENFLSSGGTILMTGEYSGFDNATMDINAALSDFYGDKSLNLSGDLTIQSAEYDDHFHYATTANGQIAADPLTAGVGSFSYAATSQVSGGIPLFYTSNNVGFMEYATTPAITETAESPEPSVGLLVLCGVVGLILAGRRQKRYFEARQIVLPSESFMMTEEPHD